VVTVRPSSEEVSCSINVRVVTLVSSGLRTDPAGSLRALTTAHERRQHHLIVQPNTFKTLSGSVWPKAFELFRSTHTAQHRAAGVLLESY
jgi:hypothetical protein